ncbi:IstB domain protein ATP-binding protein [Evansella cellulosilytica DSM 2522]|uniref:IstB domain protein ATP-binding protein n=2 Tax=Evansella TaxID=2837485 RepID=E6TVI2_EVAC2|nr:IstB domain protein ATP-binding protein [Evansella cellulosilytica DSM 2522]
MTSKIENQTSNDLFSTVVFETDVCECGNPYNAAYLQKFRDYKARGFLAYRCEVCQKKVNEEEWRKKVAEEENAIALENCRKFFFEESILDKKLKLATFDNYHPRNDEQKKGKEIAIRYVNSFDHDNPRGLLLFGNYGTGKSHLSVSIAKKIVDKRNFVVFLPVPDYLANLKATYGNNSDTELRIINKIARVPLLILDDIGRVDPSGWVEEKLFQIINRRIGMHTIYTSNFGPSELPHRIGGRNFSRMMEDVHPLRITGDDHRLKHFK